MAKTINIDPITRIEGHLAVRLETESDRVVNAFISGEMFRGFEMILKGRDPLDAQQITQRICGVCPVSHGMASILAQEMIYKTRPPQNGRLVRNIILAANYIQSHIIHFYQLSAPDFLDIKAITKYQGQDPLLRELKEWAQSQMSSNTLFPAAPFLPNYDAEYIKDTELNITALKHYFDALDIRALAHKMGAIFGGKLPHASALVPCGVTEKVTALKIAACKSIIIKLQEFIDNSYLSDVSELAKAFPEYLQLGKGCGNFMAYGVFPESGDHSIKLFPGGVFMENKTIDFDVKSITEDVLYSHYSSPSNLGPDQGRTVPYSKKNRAYSWIKAPRYNQAVMEVGPLARIMIAYRKGKNAQVKKLTDAFLNKLDAKPEILDSCLGRHAVRAIECKIIADRCSQWIDALIPEKNTFRDFDIPESGQGVGLTEAPRGALGHWITLRNYKIDNYQCVVPTTWNCSPRDDRGIPGPVEQALVGTPISDHKNPIEATRVVRSFDPCIACAVH